MRLSRKIPHSHIAVSWTAITLTFTSSLTFVPVLTIRSMTTYDDSTTNEHTRLIGQHDTISRTESTNIRLDAESRLLFESLSNAQRTGLFDSTLLNDGEPKLDWTLELVSLRMAATQSTSLHGRHRQTSWNMFSVEADTGCRQDRCYVDQPARSGWIVDSRKSEAGPWGSADELDRTFCFCCAETGCGASSNLSSSLAPYSSKRTLPELLRHSDSTSDTDMQHTEEQV